MNFDDIENFDDAKNFVEQCKKQFKKKARKRDNEVLDIIIKRVGTKEFPRYVLVQGGKYYNEMFFPDGSRSNGWAEAFEDALWFASWKNASWRMFNLKG